MLAGEAFQAKPEAPRAPSEEKNVPPVLKRRANASAFQSAKVLQNAMSSMSNKFFNRPDEWQCEYLRFRHRFVDQAKGMGVPLPNNFKFRIYLQETAAEKLGELCELDPIMISIFWVPMGAVAIAVNLIFMTEHESLEANGGAFLENSPFFMLCLPFLFPLWSVFNYRANLKIKRAIVPQPFADGDTSAEYHSPAYLKGEPVPGDDPNACPPANLHKHEKLFTIFGFEVGHEVYLELQKLNLFCMVLTMIFSFKTFYANVDLLMEGGEEGEHEEAAAHHGRMLHGAEASAHGGEGGEEGIPPGTMPELLYTFAALVLNILGLCITPSTFIQFNYATATEGFIDMECLSKVLRDQNKDRLASTLASLLLFSERLSKVAVPMSLKVTVLHETLMHEKLQRETSTKGESPKGSQSPTLQSRRRTPEQVDMDWAALLEHANPDSLIDLRHFVSSQAASNVIKKADVNKMARELGYTLENERLDGFFAYMDVDGGGEVDFKEFATALLLSPREEGDVSDSPASFKERLASGASNSVKAQLYELFDADHGGTIDEEEFVERLAAWGCDTLGVETLFNDIAGQEQTTISKKQFYKFLTMRTKEVSEKHGVQKIN